MSDGGKLYPKIPPKFCGSESDAFRQKAVIDFDGTFGRVRLLGNARQVLFIQFDSFKKTSCNSSFLTGPHTKSSYCAPRKKNVFRRPKRSFFAFPMSQRLKPQAESLTLVTHCHDVMLSCMLMPLSSFDSDFLPTRCKASIRRQDTPAVSFIADRQAQAGDD